VGRRARSGTAKDRAAATSCATRDAPRWSDVRRLWATVQLRAKLGATRCTLRDAKGRDAAVSCARRDSPRWSDARRLWAAAQLWAEPGATLCTQRDGQVPRRSGELRKAPRSEVE